MINFKLISSSTRLITDATQKQSRIFLWLSESGGTVHVSGKDRHMCRIAIREALELYGFPLSTMDHLTWVPRCVGCFIPHYTIDLPRPLQYLGKAVDLHVRMK